MNVPCQEIIERAADPQGGLHQMGQFLEACRAAGFKSPSPQHPGFQILAHLFGNAPAFGLFCITHPEEALDLIPRAAAKKGPVARPSTRKNIERDLRLGRMREWTYALAEFLAGRLSVEGLGLRLSEGADRLIDLACRHIAPQGSIAVIALGKLGAVDLNVSSDIDLIFMAEEESTKTAQAAERLVASLATQGPEGRAFRVDMGLRPAGNKGPLIQTVDGYESYYETFGEEWERIALIRARPVAGNKKLGEAFLRMATPFVWRKSLDLDALERLKQLKKRTESLVAEKGHETFHLKLSPGGIREIEFTVHFLQLAYGGIDPLFRTFDLRRAIDLLGERKIIPPTDATALKEAYTFFRHAENALQMEEDQQAYLVPLGESKREELAVRMFLPGATRNDQRNALEARIQKHAEAVQNIFSSLFP